MKLTKNNCLTATLKCAVLCGSLAMSPQIFAEESGECDQFILPSPLKGLCISYCKGMDCDSEQPRANKKTCDRLKATFVRLDHQNAGLPCEDDNKLSSAD